ncbi:MAG: DNA-binding protein WhiA [Lachnospiraceae bacterium]|nr:DNA-binding protein WhiA [Lachnospiraceae bacterium]
MSFSSRIKEELSSQIPPARHCQLAELSAMSLCLGKFGYDDQEDPGFVISTENAYAARKYFTLFQKSLKVGIGVSVRTQPKKDRMSYQLFTGGQESAMQLLRLKGSTGEFRTTVDQRLCKSSCCKRACLRGYFLCLGSMSSPESGYHLELATPSRETADQILELMGAFSLEGKYVKRKKYHVVYLKGGEGIADFLKVIGAPKALLEFENTRIYKDMRGRVNRKVNCEAANITKTVTAAARQVEDIRLIDRMQGLDTLSSSLRQMALLRLEMPEASLEELGKMSDPPVGKSGVNHRLRKLSQLADSLREG